MPEHDNDRLEQFFQKAAAQPEVPFDESDWRKLEARLDAKDLLLAQVRKSQTKLVVATGVILVLLFSVALWMNYLYDFIPVRRPAVQTVQSADAGHQDNGAEASADDTTGETVAVVADDKRHETDAAVTEDLAKTGTKEAAATTGVQGDDRSAAISMRETPAANDRSVRDRSGEGEHHGGSEALYENKQTQNPGRATPTSYSTVVALDDARILTDLTAFESRIGERNKQKAKVELPGAEEVKTSVAEAEASTEQVSDPESHQRTPRLSLLLSFAPDFSGTSLSRYSAPGKAFGAMVHYHLTNRWRISAGVIKNNKQYSGSGEEYHPPQGYWKYYTNGRVPNSVYGACTVLEFPLMANYSIRQRRKNTWSVGGGVSSYLMLDESYQYVFDEPNPGAKDGWRSGGSSHFVFNMINVTAAYEHEVLPGFRIGVEPYVKIPVSKIGWSNLKLFSTGASLTLRYVLVRQKDRHLYMPGRGPD